MPLRVEPHRTWKTGSQTERNILEPKGGKDMAWIIGTAVFIILFLAAIYVVAGIAVSVAGSYQTD